MKKRFLALALCLVMTVSLLPISAAAYTPVDMMGWINGIENNGIYCKEASFTVDCPESYSGTVKVSLSASGSSTELMPVDGQYKITEPLGSILVDIHFGSTKIAYLITINSDHTWDVWTSNGDGSHSRSCGNGCGTSETEGCVDANPVDCKCDDCRASMHDWQYTTTGKNSLKATCQNAGCNIGTVGVTLTADSVTLPNSPFKANLTFEGNFKEVFHCSEIEYQYEDPVTGWDYVNPDTFTPKPGNYQAGVLITGLPGNGGAAARAVGNEDGAGQGSSVYLFVKYTAVDPKVTAQTGDNRPIELMLVSAAVFSVLAAAAFILDDKRKYSR